MNETHSELDESDTSGNSRLANHNNTTDLLRVAKSSVVAKRSLVICVGVTCLLVSLLLTVVPLLSARSSPQNLSQQTCMLNSATEGLHVFMVQDMSAGHLTKHDSGDLVLVKEVCMCFIARSLSLILDCDCWVSFKSTRGSMQYEIGCLKSRASKNGLLIAQ